MGDMSIHFCQWCGGTLGGDNPCQCGAAMEIAALRAECARKDSALENSYRLVEEAFYDGFSCAVFGNGDANARELWPHSLSKSDLEIARAALAPSDAGKARAASLSARVVADLEELETHGLLEIFREQNRDLCDRLLRQLETK